MEHLSPMGVSLQTRAAALVPAAANERAKAMKHTRATLFALAALALGTMTVSAEAANCSGRRDTGTAVGAVGGGLVGNAAGHGDAGSTIAGAVIGGVAGNLIGGSDCNSGNRYNVRNGHRMHYDRRGRAYWFDARGRRHYR